MSLLRSHERLAAVRAGVLIGDDIGPANPQALKGASRTNPEFDLGVVLTLQGPRETSVPGQRPVAALTRVSGRPAAIAFALICAAGRVAAATVVVTIDWVFNAESR